MAAPQWWQDWRNQAGQYGQLGGGAQTQVQMPASPPPQSQSGASNGYDAQSIYDGISAIQDPKERRKGQMIFGLLGGLGSLMSGGRIPMPPVGDWIGGGDRGQFVQGLLESLPSGGSSSQATTPDWYRKWRDERGNKGLL